MVALAFQAASPERNHLRECCIIDAEVINFRVAESQATCPALVLPRAESWSGKITLTSVGSAGKKVSGKLFNCFE